MRAVSARGPAAHHRVRHLSMKLDREGGAGSGTPASGIIALGEQLDAARQVEALAMPLIDVGRPVRADRAARRGRADRVIADLAWPERCGATLRRDASPASARRGRCRGTAAALQRHPDPVDLAPDVVVRDHWRFAARRRSPRPHARPGLRQRIAERGPADVERMAERAQRVADTAGRRLSWCRTISTGRALSDGEA